MRSKPSSWPRRLAVFGSDGPQAANQRRSDEREKQAQEDDRQAVEEQGQDDREPVAGLHEPEQRPVLADQETDQCPEGNYDCTARGDREDQVSDASAEQPYGREQRGSNDAGSDKAEQEEGADRWHDREVGLVVLLGVEAPTSRIETAPR